MKLRVSTRSPVARAITGQNVVVCNRTTGKVLDNIRALKLECNGRSEPVRCSLVIGDMVLASDQVEVDIDITLSDSQAGLLRLLEVPE